MTVLILVIAGLRYIVKSDDANSISETKRMIAYTLVGLVVIVVAGTIVEYVLKAL